MLIPCGPAGLSRVAKSNLYAGTFWRYVLSDLVAALCSLVRRSIDFQQLNGRNVGVVVAIMFGVNGVMFKDVEASQSLENLAGV